MSRRSRRPRRTQRGQALVETAVLTFAMMVVLYGAGQIQVDAPDGRRVRLLALMLNSIQIYMDNFYTMLSLPIP